VLLDAVIDECAGSEVKELRRLGGTLTKWRSEILAHHTTGDSNAPTEAVNLLIKTRTSSVYRPRLHQLRALSPAAPRPLRFEWQTHRTPSMRGRSPHLAA
jgi:hypothetical protein